MTWEVPNILPLQTMVRTIQRAQHKVAASQDRAPQGQTPTSHPTSGQELPDVQATQQVHLCPGDTSAQQNVGWGSLRPELRAGRCRQVGAGALLFPAAVALPWQPRLPVLMLFYLAVCFLCCFILLDILISFYFSHVAVIHSPHFSLLAFLSIEGKKYSWRRENVTTLSHRGFVLVWMSSFCQPNFIPDVRRHTCFTKSLPAQCRLAKIVSQGQGEETEEIRCRPTCSRSSKKPTAAS